MNEPTNDLEGAFATATQGLEGRPEFFRQLRQSPLSFLMPGHSAGQTFTAGNSGGLIFAVWVRKNEPYIPIFTSVERAKQALKITSLKNRQTVFQMNGDELFRAIAARKPSYGVVINPACGTGEMLLDTTAVRLLADGSILEPLRPEKRESGIVQIVEPADYPAQLLEPLSRYLRGCAAVRAAWLFRHQPVPATEATYIVGLLMKNGEHARQVEQDLIVVAKGVRPVVKCSATILDPNDPAVAAVTAKSAPFYAATD